jgi:two-component system, chemotaxis family, protein-glutamate methylesterase/glutaminase
MESSRNINATCPECRGPLTEIQLNGMREYRCLVGHAYSPRSVLQAHSEAQEKALWAAVVALEEAANLARIVAPQFAQPIPEKLEAQAVQKLQQAAEVRGVLEHLEPFVFD